MKLIEETNNYKVGTIRLLTLRNTIKEIRLMKIKNNKTVKDYSNMLMDVINQIR